MDDWRLRIGDKLSFIRALRRQNEMPEGSVVPDIGLRHCAGDVLRDGVLVSGCGRILVERNNAECSNDGPAPERRVEHLRGGRFGEWPWSWLNWSS